MRTTFIKIIIALICTSTGITNISRGQVPVQDSLILVDFYYSTNGQQWNHHDNWLDTVVRLWWGVAVVNNKVIAINLQNNNLIGTINYSICQMHDLGSINLSNNNLTGEIPQCIGELNLNGLRLSQNHLTGLLPESLGRPGLSFTTLYIDDNYFSGLFPDTLVNATFLQNLNISGNLFISFPERSSSLYNYLSLGRNRLTFKDLVFYHQSIPNIFNYSPQDSILSEIDTIILPGTSLVLDSWVDTCSGNMYQWKKNGSFLSPMPTGNPLFIKNNISYSDSGDYTCDVTNGAAWQLTLHRRQIHVHVSDPNNIPPLDSKETEIKISYNIHELMLKIAIGFSGSTFVDAGLYDLMGRKTLRLFYGNTQNLDLHYCLGNIKKGIYFVKVMANNRQLVSRVVVD